MQQTCKDCKNIYEWYLGASKIIQCDKVHLLGKTLRHATKVNPDDKACRNFKPKETE